MGGPLWSVLLHIGTLAANQLSDNRANYEHFVCCLTNVRFHNIIFTEFRTGQTVGTVKCAYGMPGSWLSAAQKPQIHRDIANGRGTAISKRRLSCVMPIGHSEPLSSGTLPGAVDALQEKDVTARANRKAVKKVSDTKQGRRLPKNRRRA